MLVDFNFYFPGKVYVEFLEPKKYLVILLVNMHAGIAAFLISYSNSNSSYNLAFLTAPSR